MLEPPAEFAASVEQLKSGKSVNKSGPELGGAVVIGNKQSPKSVSSGSKDNATSEEVLEEQANESEEDVEITMIDDEDPPELFQPSSPLEFDRNLPDIIEEEEEDGEEEKSFKEQEESMLRDIHESHKEPNELVTVQSQGAVDEVSGISDTNGSDPMAVSLSVKEFDCLLKDLRLSQLLEITGEKSWRVSRQPESFEKLPIIAESPDSGEAFSPRMSVLLPDEEHGGSSMVEMSQELVTALKMISTDCAEEGPPEFPSSPPPGKLLSPRHSFRTPGVERSLKRSLSHKERDFLKQLGSHLERMEEGQEVKDRSLERIRSQPNAATASHFESRHGLLDKNYL